MEWRVTSGDIPLNGNLLRQSNEEKYSLLYVYKREKGCYHSEHETILYIGEYTQQVHFGQWVIKRDSFIVWMKIVMTLAIASWAPSQYKDRLIYVWRFPC